MIRAAEAREIAEAAGSPDWLQDILQDVESEIRGAAELGKRTVASMASHTYILVDNYRHHQPTDVQAALMRELHSLGYKAELEREKENLGLGPVKDRCFVRISW